jgi:hypothetical protein
MRYFAKQENEILALRSLNNEVGENVAQVPNESELSRAKTQALFFAGVAFLSLMIPFGFGWPQWLIGTIINTVLFLSVIFLPKKYWLALIIFPSLGVLARGLIFGPLTFFLIYFLPFIWLGNWILMLVFEKAIKKFQVQNPGLSYAGFKYLFSVLLASLAKFLFLFLTVSLYFNLKVVPKIFVASIGLNQLGTALAGGVISFLIYKAFKNYKTKNI